MRVPLSDIKAVSQCPAYYTLLKQAPKKPAPLLAQIAEGVIKKAYINTADTGFRLTWRNIVAHVDRKVFKNINVEDAEEYKTGKATSEYILSFLQQWYHKMYLVEEAIGYAGIDLTAEVDGHVITATAPIIKLGDGATVMRVSNVVYTIGQLYNDIGMRGLLWFASEALDCEAIAGQHLAIGPQGGWMKPAEVKIDKNDHRRAKKAILQALSLIEAGIEFPSVTERCNVCPFQRRCRL